MNTKEYEKELHRRELSQNTITKYLKDVNDFLEYAEDQEITQELLIQYKNELLDKFKISTVNTKTTIINNYMKFQDEDIAVKQERTQRSNVLDDVLSEKDFERLIRMANTKGNERARVTMLSLYYTGIRVSELEFLTVEALKKGHMEITNKGKYRRVPINKKLSKELKKYIKDEEITEGYIIKNNRGNSLSRSYIYKEMKYLGGQARVKLSRVYPHSIRHLFAKRYLKYNNNNALALADILGHSSVDTTRVYSTLNTKEQSATMDF